MAKMAQFRYYSDDNPNNSYPAVESENYSVFCADTAFRGYAPIHQFGIQTLPGTKIYINQSSMEIIRNLPNGYLVIDIVYGSEED